MKKILFVDQEKCVGCGLCELACSLSHEGVFNPVRSRISILPIRQVGTYLPMVCPQCTTPLCADVCPVNAILTVRVGIDYYAKIVDANKCVGCRMCMNICPIGGVFIDPEKGKAISCDLCDGDPACVKVCGYGSLKYIDLDRAVMEKRIAGVSKMSELVAKL